MSIQSKGGLARAANLTAKQRHAAALHAAQVRWSKPRRRRKPTAKWVKHRMGRPKKAPADRRSSFITFRVTQAEYDQLAARADATPWTVPNYVRQKLFAK